MKYQETIKGILENIGSEENIDTVTHCMTRLRFNLKDDSKADLDALKKVKGVVASVNKGGQLQVVIGTHVNEVYDELVASTNVKKGGSIDEEPKQKRGVVTAFFDTMASMFMPMIGSLAGAGMIKAILSIAVQFGLLNKADQAYQIFYMVSDTVFYYMPFFLAFSAAKKFKCNPFLALIFAAMLVHPTYMDLKAAGDPVSLFGLPVTLATYTTSVVPIILIVYFQSIVEKFVTKFTPNAIKVFFVPMVVILITVPVAFVVLGPLGAIVGTYIAKFFIMLDTHISWLVPTIMGGLVPLFVMTGMHHAIGSAQAIQRATVGYATIQSPGMVCSNMAQSAATFGVALKTKNKELKSLATSAGVTALCGITEPALYGISMKLKRPLYSAMAAGAIGGLFAGITRVKQWAYGTSTVFALPVYIGEDNSFVNICIAVGISMILGFIFSYLSHKDPEDTTEIKEAVTSKLTKKEQVTAPMTGAVLSLNEVSDDAFKSEAMGKGCAIVPVVGKVIAPVDGVIVATFETQHALGIKADNGMEILIHVGIDTVKLNGQFFKSYVKKGDKIKRGELLLEFDLEKIVDAGYDITTPIIITNTKDYLDVIETTEENVTAGDYLMTGVK